MVNFSGILIGLFMLAVIGIGFLWVIKLEYHFGSSPWKIVLGLGLLVCLASLWIPSFWGSALIGIIGGSIVWGATELPEQEERAQRGLFPIHPKRRKNGQP